MAHLLDQHPDISMSYEVYEHLLDPARFSNEARVASIPRLGFSRKGSPTDWFLSQTNIQRFIARAARSGVTEERVLEIIRPGYGKDMAASNLGYRCTLVEAVCQEKAASFAKSVWGAKIASQYRNIAAVYERAFFIYIVRDVRDIYASRKMLGTFRQNPKQVAQSWSRQLRGFQAFASENPDGSFLVSYERLVRNPEVTLRMLLNRLGVSWDPQMLSGDMSNSTLLNNPAGHLSAQQLAEPITAKSVGRWQRELSPDELESIEEIAGALFQELGLKS